MSSLFSRDHSSMIIRYIGISFITGAISHGVFSETRALLTGILGIALFTFGSYLEEAHSKPIQWNILLSGALLAIGIGAVTGGLQHFPDSPERSVWIIPVGLALSLWFYAKSHGYTIAKKERHYIYIVMTIGILLTLSLYGVIEYTGITGHNHGATSDH